MAVSLLEGGADSEQEDREDLTALHWAVRLGKERVVVVLLDHHADVEVRPCGGGRREEGRIRGGGEGRG